MGPGVRAYRAALVGDLLHHFGMADNQREKSQRQHLWLDPTLASRKVRAPALRELIASFGNN
jgi:hypothetical protein